jgi:type III pantothenate kinase
MKVDIVVDVGNSRIKWGLVAADGLVQLASLPSDDPQTWQRQLAAWHLTGPLSWALSGVQPQRRDQLAGWIRERGDTVRTLEHARQLPLRVEVEQPDKVGIDRLLNALAANLRVRRDQKPRHGRIAIIVDAGSAVTVDLVDEAGAFRGGAILPGLRLMAHALHDHTALLPLIEIQDPSPPVLGTSTIAAMESGVYYGVAGAINTLVTLLAARSAAEPAVYLTGGDAVLLQEAVDQRAVLWPEMTLEGVRIAAEAQP